MAIVIKEIRVTTVVERKIIQPPDISEEVLIKLKNDVVAELKLENDEYSTPRQKNKR